MAEIAELFPENAKKKYRDSLKDFRLPYWDYYKPRNQTKTKMPGITQPGGATSFEYDFGIPQVFTVESVMVRRTSDDQLEPLENPLNRFIFPSSGGFADADWTLVSNFSKKQTVRYPSSISDTKGSSTLLNATLNRERENNTTIILDMIKDYNSFASFSSDSLSPGLSGSLEDIHGNYHGLIGGPRGRQGHMSQVPIAAFDPIFWIHHCQIDRWLAIWQAAHPDKWFDGQYQELVNRRWTPTDIAPLAEEVATDDFGYVYKDAIGSPQEVRAKFASLYSWAVRSRTGTGKYGPPPPDMVPNANAVNSAQVFQYTAVNKVTNFASSAAFEAPQTVINFLQTTTSAASEKAGISSSEKAEETNGDAAASTNPVAPEANNSDISFTNLLQNQVAAAPNTVDESRYSRDWYVDNVVERLALNGSFTIFYFVGNFNSVDVENYELQPTMAGLNHVFTSSREACDNCGVQAEEGHLISGTKPITPMLLDYVKIGELPDITPANVVPFLTKNLKWRIVGASGEPANPRTVAGFKVGVSSKLSPLTGTDGGPIYEEYPQIVEQIIANAS
ncbi:MAG: hypothetical protein Q9157_005808 [Trypethelium eluteriae]